MIGYTLASLKVVKADQQAARTFFGRPINSVGSGLIFVPLGIYSLHFYTTNIITISIGGPREQPVERNADGKIIKFQLVSRKGQSGDRFLVSEEPLRIVTSSRSASINWSGRDQGNNDPFPKTDALAHRVAMDPLVIVQFKIVNPCQFLTEVGLEIKDILPPLAEITRTILQGYVGDKIPAYIIHQLEKEVPQFLKYKLEQLLGDKEAKDRAKAAEKDVSDWNPRPWGVDVSAVRISDPGLPFRVNEALAEARKAGPDKDATVIRAEGERQRMEALEKFASGSGGEMMLRLEQLRTIAETIGPTDKVVLVDSQNPIAGILGAVVGGKALFQSPSSPPSQPPTNP